MFKGKLPARARKSSVYVIERTPGVVKIGRSHEPARRRDALQTANPDRLTLVYAWPVSNAEAVRLEAELHRLLRPSRLSGEWHRVEADTIKALFERLVDGEIAAAEALADAANEVTRVDLERDGREVVFAACRRLVALGGGNEWDRDVFA